MRKSIHAVYSVHAINGFASSLIGIFIPAYLLQLGYPVSQVLLFYLLFALGIFISFLLANLVASWIGLRLTLLLNFVALAAYLVVLYGLHDASTPVWIIAIPNAMYAAFYWFPLHVFFTTHADDEKTGNNVAKLFAFPQLLSIPGPLIGAAIAVLGGFKLLFLVAAVIYLVSLVPIFFIPEIRPPTFFKFSRFWALAKRYPRYVIVEIVEDIRQEMEGIILPLFIFLTFRSVLSIGILGSLLAAGSALFMLLVGRYSNALRTRSYLRIGGMIMIALWLGRFYATGQVIFYLLTLLAGFFEALILIPFNAAMYGFAKKEGGAEFIIFREIPVTIARIIVYAIAFTVVVNLRYLFLLPVFSSALYWVF